MTENPERKRPSSNARYSEPNATTTASAYIHNGRPLRRATLLMRFVLQCSLPTSWPPGRGWRRAIVGESEWAELAQRSYVDGTLEIDHLFDRPPVVDPATTIEFGLWAKIEAHAFDRGRHVQQEPTLLLADAQRRLGAADVTVRQAIAQPPFGRADDLHVALIETHLFVKLTEQRC